jgi:hypothetical protein
MLITFVGIPQRSAGRGDLRNARAREGGLRLAPEGGEAGEPKARRERGRRPGAESRFLRLPPKAAAALLAWGRSAC